MARIRYYDSTTQEWVFADLAVQAPLIEGTAVGDTLVWNGTDWICRAAEPSVLPALYQEVEYISGDGTQYLQLGFPLGPTSRAVLDLERLGPNAWGSEWDHENLQPGVFGCGNSTTAGRYDIVLNNYGLKVYCDEDYYQFLSIPSNPYGEDRCRALFDFDMTTGKYYVDGSQAYSFQVPTTASTYNACIFATNIAGTISNKITMRMYGAEFYTSGTLISKLIPCYRISDNVIGVYDIVSNTFLTNAGTGVFGKGANISGKEDTANKVTSLSSSSTDTEYPSAKCVYTELQNIPSMPSGTNAGDILVWDGSKWEAQSSEGLPSAYERVEWIESEDGNAFIDTGVYPKGTSGIRYDFSYIGDFVKWDVLLGIWENGKHFNLIFGEYDGSCEVHHGSQERKPLNFNRNKRYMLAMESSWAECADFSTTYSTQSFTTSNTLKIVSAGFVNRMHRVWRFTYYESGVKLNDFIPCYRKSDNEIGMYDIVNRVFHTNAGTGNFIIPT